MKCRVNLQIYLAPEVSEEVFEALTTLQRHGLLFWEHETEKTEENDE